MITITTTSGTRQSNLQSNMPKLYSYYCDMYFAHDSPCVRKTHCSIGSAKRPWKAATRNGWKKARNLLDNVAAAFQQQQKRYNLSLHSLFFLLRGQDPTSSKLPEPLFPGTMMHGRSSNDVNYGPILSGMMPMGHISGMRPQMEGHRSMMPEPPIMRPLACSLMVPGMTWPGDTSRGALLSVAWQGFLAACKRLSLLS